MIHRVYLIALLLMCNFVAYSATFKVQVPPETIECYVTGAFNSWSSANASKMTKIDATHFELELPEVTDVSGGYKYLSGPGMAFVEMEIDGTEAKNRTSTTPMDVVQRWSVVYIPSLKPGIITINAKVPIDTPANSVYITGSFQNWDASNAIKMEMKEDGSYSISIPDCTQITYKLLCDRSFDYVEKIGSNREANSEVGVYNINVSSWQNVPKTALNTVYIDNLLSYGIWICLPPDYNSSNKSYPVTYIQDGQNIFIDTDKVGSWNLGTVMKALYDEGKATGIIVGIDKNPTFIYDYSPCENDRYSKTGGADKYINTVINEIMPYINTNYRTLTGSANTSIVGSDMGGLLAFYAAIKHPEVFGYSAILSPYFWFAKDFLITQINSIDVTAIKKMVILSGDAEGSVIPEDAEIIFNELKGRNVPVTFDLIKGGLHNNESWGAQFKNIYPYLFDDISKEELITNIQATANILHEKPFKNLKEVVAQVAPYSFMSDNGSGKAVCSGTEHFIYNNCNVKGAEVEKATYVKVVPASVKTSWYSNINSSEDCTGNTLSASNYKVDFKSTKTKDSWLRYYVDPVSSSVDIINASSEGFRVNGILMTRCDSEGNNGSDDSFSLKATINTSTSKSYTVNYGSVNSQSDMGAITELLTVPENAIKVEVIYSYLTNKTKLNILETGGGVVDPEPSKDYQFMPHSSSGASCTGNNAFYSISYYPNGNNETPVDRMAYIYTVPTSVTGTWYFNANNSSDCTGSKVYASDRSVNFGTRSAGSAWIKVLIDDAGKTEDVAVSSTFFRVKQGDAILTLMTPTGNEYEQSSEIELSSDASRNLEIRYGSVNSGSIQGSLLGSSDTYPVALPKEWNRARVLYNFLTNQVNFTEISEPIVPKPEIAYLLTSQGVCEVGADVLVKAKILNADNYNIKFYLSYNRGEYKLCEYVKNGEELNYNFIAQSGIYFIKITATDQLDVVTTFDEICVKVIADKEMRILSSNPYENIDWATINQFKGTFHVHTDWTSDCSIKASDAIDMYASKDYKILPLTNHDFNSYPMFLLDMFKPTWEARNVENMGMLCIPGIELSANNHHNDFFTGRCDNGADIQKSFAITKSLNGMQIINHPGLYWNINDTYSVNAKNSAEWHAHNFMNFESLVGLEVYNQGNRYSNDRILWDEILSITMPKRTVYGYSNDDSHHFNQYFFNYDFMLMDELTIPALKKSMKNGNFYASYEYGGTGFALAPRIEKVVVNDIDNTITVTPDNGVVYWVSGIENSGANRKSAVIGIGNTINYSKIRAPYIRAMVKNKWGETILQPFGFSYFNPTSDPLVQIKKDHDIIIYPNPTYGEVNIKCNDKISNAVLYSLSGAMVKKFEAPNSKIDLDVVAGAYILRVITEYTIESQMIIIK